MTEKKAEGWAIDELRSGIDREIDFYLRDPYMTADDMVNRINAKLQEFAAYVEENDLMSK